MDYIQLNPQGIVTFLTNIYDRGSKGYIYRLKHDEHVLKNPYVMMCACSTPNWLTDQLKTKQFSEGYGRRTIIVCHEGIIRKKPTLSEEEREAGRRCEKRLVQIQNLAGSCRLTPDADKWFWETWYPNQKDPADTFTKNWYSSRHVNVLKIAMLTMLSESDELVVTINHVQLALALLEEVEKSFPMITSLMGRGELTEPVNNVLHYIKNKGGWVREKEMKKDLMFKDFKNPFEYMQVIDQLKQTEQIRVIEGHMINGVVCRIVAVPECVIEVKK
jgi:hypothetical protein